MTRSEAEGLPGRNIGKEVLLARPIPLIPQEQVDLYSADSLQLKRARLFDPSTLIATLRGAHSTRVYAIDIGGDKIAAQSYQINKGRLQTVERREPLRRKLGGGYIEYMERIAEETDGGKGYVIGISFGDPIERTKPKHTYLSELKKDLNGRYDGDMANIFPQAISIGGDNDAVAGCIAGVTHAVSNNPAIEKVLYVIHGNGYGGAIWTRNEGILYAAEPGHIPVIDQLNPFGRNEPCGQP